ncbi:MAG: phosphatidylserine decarboxylase family protein [Candidatus Puniceispirillum sp.]|nr:phosphatidylserine decarboxylase family protein [Candidatus Puniceispirillum sp.]
MDTHTRFAIHREGWKFIIIFALVAMLFATFSTVLGWVGAILTLWCVLFFRDPQRVTPVRDGLIISPADGVVSAIAQVEAPKELDLPGTYTRVSIFLNVFDVHVNRVPLGGTLIKSVYHPGRFINASLDKASEHNERQSLVVEAQGGLKIAFVQIAGLIARRIVCDVREGDVLKTGQRFGMIRFGSRADVYLPEGIAPLVVEGQRMVAGESVLADLSSKETAREGEVR